METALLRHLVPTAGAVVTPRNWCGFLRPEFVLGLDYQHADPNDPWWSRNARLGEDLLVNNALQFDVQVYDPTASWISDLPDPPPPPPPTGRELVVGPIDAGYREELNYPDPIPNTYLSQGGFVDLAYPVLAGGSVRGWTARARDRRSGSATDSALIGTNAGLLLSDFSGLTTENPANLTDTGSYRYQSSLFRSGRVVLNNAGNIVLFQPTFDTFTSFYERDGLLQDMRLNGPMNDPNSIPQGTILDCHYS